ncbi:MAG: TonB family protein [Deltaproteobacteria bacterium]|nr:TonB family protein [Deltaproteobacteria bacterium]
MLDGQGHRKEEREQLERLCVALAIAVLLHAAAVPLVPHMFPDVPPVPIETRSTEVELVKLLPELFSEYADPSGDADERPASEEEKAAARKARDEERLKKEEQEKTAQEEEKKKDDGPGGQIVYIGPTGDGQAPEKARFRAEYNSKVEKETISKYRRNDYLNPLPTPSATKEQSAGAGEGGVKAVGMALQVTPKEAAEKEAAQKKEASPKGGEEFVLKLPNIERRDEVSLAFDDRLGTVENSRRSEGILGNSDHYELRLRGGKPEEGDEGARLPPRIAALMPGPATLSRVAGGPFADHVEDVEEGEGTFLNAKEYRYATFFNRVKRGVSQNWEPGLQLSKRDPYGNVYGTRDRLTVLKVTLDSQGNLMGAIIQKGSGIDFLDSEAIAAFQRAQPFPNPPLGLVRDGAVSFDFGFYVEFSSSNFRLFRYRGAE